MAHPDRYLETEIKLYVEDLNSVAVRLEVIGATLVRARVFERNVRYENVEENLATRGIVIRLRRDHSIRLTYKEPVNQPESDIRSRFEAEVEVSDYDTMDLILKKMGYIPHVIYEKYRTTYTLDDTEIVLDEMPYGQFVEIEGAPEAIRVVIGQLGLQDARSFQINYLQLFDYARQNLKLDFHDLTFENFEGLKVPLSAFMKPISDV